MNDESPRAERLRRLLPGVWLGALAAIALVAAPAAFALLPAHDAGRVAGRMFAVEAHASLVLALAAFALERGRARRVAAAGEGSPVRVEMLLPLGTLFCTVAGYFALLPLMESARSGAGPLSFGALHAVSTAFYAVKALLVAALAWRVTPARDA